MDETGVKRNVFLNSLNEFEKRETYKILLSHYPENINEYKDRNVNLVLSGHAHGGQFILPFVGGVYAPGQGFFPEYYKGKYNVNGTDFIVSSGLGNSSIPIRLFNRPEVIVINLKSR
jgi:predicted MPP superfamily phosphohydrolase